MITGCVRCGKSEEGMNITMFKGNPYCDDCFKIECPPITTVNCSMRCGNTVSDPTELTKHTPCCPTCRAKSIAAMVELRQYMDRDALSSIELRTDVFNAKTQAIIDLEKQIMSDETITNKPYAFAEALKNRFEKLREVIFNLNAQIADAGSEQRAIQSYLNNLANTLRAEEREKLRIADINYKPQPINQPKVKSVKTTGTSPKKATNKEIAAAAKELGIAEFTLKAFILQTGGDLNAAVTKIKASIAAAKQ